MSLFHAEISSFLITDRLFQDIKFQPEEIGPDWTFYETLHEQRDQRLFIQRIFCNAARKLTYVLNV